MLLERNEAVKEALRWVTISNSSGVINVRVGNIMFIDSFRCTDIECPVRIHYIVGVPGRNVPVEYEEAIRLAEEVGIDVSNIIKEEFNKKIEVEGVQ
jgi:hypothetical protein